MRSRDHQGFQEVRRLAKAGRLSCFRRIYHPPLLRTQGLPGPRSKHQIWRRSKKYLLSYSLPPSSRPKQKAHSSPQPDCPWISAPFNSGTAYESSWSRDGQVLGMQRAWVTVYLKREKTEKRPPVEGKFHLKILIPAT